MAADSIQTLTNEELLERIGTLARSERKLTQSVLVHLVEAEARKLYALYGFPSMYDYLTKVLGYSDSSAYRRIQSARVLEQAPMIAEKIETGAINLSQLAEIEHELKRSAVAPGAARTDLIESLVNKVEGLSVFETRKILANEFNHPIRIHETVRPQQDDSVRLEITFSAEQMNSLRRARELLSNTLPYATWADLFSFLAEKHIAKAVGPGGQPRKDEPSEEGGASSAPAMAAACTTQRLSDSEVAEDNSIRVGTVNRKRKAIPAATKRRVFKKAKHRCEYIDPVTRKCCDSAFFLEIDHVWPFALGGSDSAENLRVYCRNHNRLAAMQWGIHFARSGSDFSVHPPS